LIKKPMNGSSGINAINLFIPANPPWAEGL
jgi:hypothetical protein